MIFPGKPAFISGEFKSPSPAVITVANWSRGLVSVPDIWGRCWRAPPGFNTMYYRSILVQENLNGCTLDSAVCVLFDHWNMLNLCSKVWACKTFSRLWVPTDEVLWRAHSCWVFPTWAWEDSQLHSIICLKQKLLKMAYVWTVLHPLTATSVLSQLRGKWYTWRLRTSVTKWKTPAKIWGLFLISCSFFPRLFLSVTINKVLSLFNLAPLSEGHREAVLYRVLCLTGALRGGGNWILKSICSAFPQILQAPNEMFTTF